MENNSGGGNAAREKMVQEENKLHISLEKGYFKVSVLADSVKSYSQFPPSVYRRSFAATRIQRAFRRWRGRKMREALKKRMNDAALVIQNMVRLKLRVIRSAKHIAAAKIQNCWRKKMLIWIALLRKKLLRYCPVINSFHCFLAL